VSRSRTHVVGLPVGVTVHDDGTLDHEVGTSEAGVSLRENDERVEQYGDAHVEADVTRVDDHSRRMASRAAS
jgi:hypothetical protein